MYVFLISAAIAIAAAYLIAAVVFLRGVYKVRGTIGAKSFDADILHAPGALLSSQSEGNPALKTFKFGERSDMAVAAGPPFFLVPGECYWGYSCRPSV